MKISAASLRKEVKKASSPARAKGSARYFKTGPGEYGEGDIFVGLTTPQTTEIAKKYRTLELKEVESLLKSKIHEERSIALTILRLQFEKGDPQNRARVYRLYLKNRKYVNNWDLVDGSAPYISGPFLFTGDRKTLYKLAHSKSLWDRRIAILSTFYFIRQKDFKDTLKIAEILLDDDHDLMHKAVGWMIREVGNRDLKTELKFLDKFATKMPRTALRYAIEKFPEPLRLKYLKQKLRA